MIVSVASAPEPPIEANSAQRDLPHVLLVVDEFASVLGGGERIALKIAALLPQYGYRASILIFSSHPESAALKSPPCPIYLLPLKNAFRLGAVRAAFAFKRFLKQQKIQIVHTFFESSDIWAGLVTRTMSKAKLVWARRDMGIMRSRKHHIAYRLMAGAPHAVFTVSKQVQRHAIEVDRIDAARVQTIYNGLNLADWDAAPRPAKNPGEFLVTTVGNIRRVKGHDVFIKAAATVVQQFPKVSFSIAGDVVEPDCLTELLALIRELGLANHVRFDGSVTNMRRHFRAADILVLPSRSEGFSNAIIEAMASSLPVVATDVGGNAEAVQDGVTGFLVPSEDVAALSAAILRLLSDPVQARAMGAAGRNVVEEKFTSEAMMNRITGAYRNLLSGK
jgi:glycosyltransferase involved in cell wall biosynthesis